MTNMHRKLKKEQKESLLKDGFWLIVDGVKYGPFLEKYREQYKDLKNKAGVVFEPVRLAAGWIEPKPAAKRQKKDKSLPLLDGLGFTAVVKTKKWF